VRTTQPLAALVYDCEALFWRRTERKAALTSNEIESVRLQEAATALRTLEERIVVDSDLTVTVSCEEAALLTTVKGCCPIRSLLPSEPDVAFGMQAFHQRVGVAYVAGWLAGTSSPNADGLRWFIAEVLPLVRQSVPWVRVHVTGADPPSDLLELADPNLIFEGHVTDLAAFYSRTRVAISPIRFGAGVKVKTVQALQYGVPVVSTSCGVEGINTYGLDAISIGETSQEFADRLVVLLTNPREWEARRVAIADLVQRWRNDPETGSWSEVLIEALARRDRGNYDLFVQH
jgi:hypothetical protein